MSKQPFLSLYLDPPLTAATQDALFSLSTEWSHGIPEDCFEAVGEGHIFSLGLAEEYYAGDERSGFMRIRLTPEGAAMQKKLKEREDARS